MLRFPSYVSLWLLPFSAAQAYVYNLAALFAQLPLHSWDLQLTSILVLVARALCITLDSILMYTYFWSSAMNRALP